MKRLSKSQALIEFALIIPIVLLLAVGAIDLSRLFMTKIVMNNAAREGAYYLSYHPKDQTNCSETGELVCFLGTIQTVKNEATQSGINIADNDIVVENCCELGEAVTVTVNHSVDLLFLDLLTGTIDMSSSVTMLVQ